MQLLKHMARCTNAGYVDVHFINGFEMEMEWLLQADMCISSSATQFKINRYINANSSF
jgi:hypothetical protein